MKENLIENKHNFKKSLGQNFIRDPQLLSALVTDAGVTKEDFVIEIGAGEGTLTEELAKTSKEVLSFEIDSSLEEKLTLLSSKYKNLNFRFMDFMKFDDESLKATIDENLPVKVVANIPYYITTPIIFRLFQFKNIESISLMIQKEVAERIVAKPNSEEYGELSVMCQFYSEPKINRIVKKNCFYPVPKVDSAFITLKTKLVKGEDCELFERVVRSAFKNRRKMLVNNLATDFGSTKDQIANIFNAIGLKPTLRAEDLGLNDYLRLYKFFKR